jgi:hypothetical protein
MNCTVPAGSAGGAAAVSVTTAGGTTSLSGGYTYIVSLSLALNKSELEMSGVPGDLIADYLIANVKTDNPKGYNLSISASDVNLTCAGDNTKQIAALPSTAGAMQNNKWGYSVSDGSSNIPSNWTGITTSMVSVDGLIGSATGENGRDVAVWFGTRVDLTQPPCANYATKVIFTAIGNI